MMQNYIDILRQLNYELVKELGLFKHRAGLSFSQRHILYHIKNNISLSIQELADFLHVEHSTMNSVYYDFNFLVIQYLQYFGYRFINRICCFCKPGLPCCREGDHFPPFVLFILIDIHQAGLD